MRVFIAIELDPDTKRKLRAVQGQLERYIEKGRFTETDNFHLTLRFIGDVDEEKRKLIEKAIDQTAAKTKAFSLNLDKLGSFKKKGREIVWAGLSGQVDALQNLYRELEQELEVLAGIEKEERAYTPHITLGRQLKLREDLAGLKITVPEAAIQAGSLSLMESIRVDGKLVYRPVQVKSLQKETE